MNRELALKTILGIFIAGILFSGYLSYGELFANSCYAAKLGMGACTSVVKIPACVYGFFMYLIVFIVSILGIRSKN